MSDETTVQLGHQELQDHNELVEYIRKLLEKIKLLTDLYDQNLTALTEHNESESSHPDLRILLAEGNDELQNQLDSFKDDITKKTDATDKRITDGLNDFDLRLRNAVEVNNVQNDRLTALEADVALKIYDKDVSAVGHTGQFDDILNRPKITISDATNEHTGNSIRITGGNTKLVLPSTITADLKGNVTGNVKGNVTGNSDTATKLNTPRTINVQDAYGTNTGVAATFDGTANAMIKLPAVITANLNGNANTATKLATAKKINGTSFNGTANITTANWGTARDITIADSTGDNTGEAVSVNGGAAVTLKLPATIKASLDGNAATATSATTAASATTATNATNAAKLGNIASSGYVQTGKVNQTIDGTKTFSAAIVGSVTGNAGSATKLATAKKINGTSFNGTANITTANWGTARDITIADSTGDNTGEAVSVNGSTAVTLKLPATIKASLDGNAATANYANSAGSANTANNANYSNSAEVSTYAQRSTNNAGFFISNYYVTVG